MNKTPAHQRLVQCAVKQFPDTVPSSHSRCLAQYSQVPSVNLPPPPMKTCHSHRSARRCLLRSETRKR